MTYYLVEQRDPKGAWRPVWTEWDSTIRHARASRAIAFRQQPSQVRIVRVDTKAMTAKVVR